MIRFIVIGILLLLVGCGSAVETAKLARTQSILVTTPFVENAKCILTDARGRTWKVRKTPSTVAVEDGHSPIQVICRKPGFKPTTVAIREGKEELLTIDGERVTLGIYDQFPTRAPRLIPTAIKEMSSFALDPTGQISTKYPDEVTVWMEPEVWESDEEMRRWGYERQVWIDAQYYAEWDAQVVDDERKGVRRELKRERQRVRKERYEKVKAAAKKATDLDTYVDATGKVLGKVGHAVDPRRPLNWAYEKGKAYEVPWAPEKGSKWEPSEDSVREPTKWVPSWMRATHSTKGKVGFQGEKPKMQPTGAEDKATDIETPQPVGDVPPWVRDRGDRVEDSEYPGQ